jgi:hypothetical protein
VLLQSGVEGGLASKSTNKGWLLLQVLSWAKGKGIVSWGEGSQDEGGAMKEGRAQITVDLWLYATGRVQERRTE